jgi:hypothetical protein
MALLARFVKRRLADFATDRPVGAGVEQSPRNLGMVHPGGDVECRPPSNIRRVHKRVGLEESLDACKVPPGDRGTSA